jgi:adenylosuccinate lyase
MIPRYTNPEMGRIWGDQRRYETWLLVETAAAEAMAAAGIVPPEAARDIRERGGFDIGRIEEIEQTTQHDVIAFTTAVAERVGPSARWLHFGLTSSDVIDTAQALQMHEACGLILKDLDALADAIRDRAFEHRQTPMIGRTHGVHAEPMTLGLKLALWYAEVGRGVDRVRRARAVVSVGKLSGAVGTFAHLPPSIEADVCGRLGLEPAAVASQVIQRDRHAELLSALAITGASLEKFALEIRGLQKTEIGELEEPFAKGQKGSSAMPHKRNPIGCEQIVGLARLLRGNCQAAFENIALWHERDISHSSVERVILPDSFIALDHMLRRFTRIVKGMVVHPDRMRENLERSRGVVFSGTVLLELAKKNVSREQAYEWVQRNAMRSFAEQRDFKSLLLADPDISQVLGPAEIERAFDLEEQFKHVDQILDRVFSPTRARAFVDAQARPEPAEGRESTIERDPSAGSGSSRAPSRDEVTRGGGAARAMEKV